MSGRDSIRSWLAAGALASLVLAGCASTAPAPKDLPAWSPTRRAAEPADQTVWLQALIVEIPARGPDQVRSGPLDMSVLNDALSTTGSRVLQSPSLVTKEGEPAELFVGESAKGESVGLRLELESKGQGRLAASFTLTDLDRSGEPYRAADASFELAIGDRPLQVEVPGKRYVDVGDEVILQDRVFLIVIEGRKP